MQTSTAHKPHATCDFSRDHADRPIVAILSYVFAGAKRRNHYAVCLECYGVADRVNLVDVRFVGSAN